MPSLLSASALPSQNGGANRGLPGLSESLPEEQPRTHHCLFQRLRATAPQGVDPTLPAGGVMTGRFLSSRSGSERGHRKIAPTPHGGFTGNGQRLSEGDLTIRVERGRLVDVLLLGRLARK